MAETSNIEIATSAGSTFKDVKPVDYEIVVSSFYPDREVTFKAAIGENGDLNLVESKTPFRKRFSAYRIIAMFETVDSNEKIKVELFAPSIRTEGPIGGYCSNSGGIYKEIEGGTSIFGGIF